MKNLINIYNKIKNVFNKIEEYILVVFLSLLIILSFLQILIRIISSVFQRINSSFHNFSINIGPIIAFSVKLDPMIKFSILWIALIAASNATIENKHIKIDLIGRFTKGRTKSVVLAITNLFTFLVSLVLTVTSILYIKNEVYPAHKIVEFLNIELWILIIIVPIGFGIIGFRFLLKFIRKMINIIVNNEDEIYDEDDIIDLD